MDKLVETILKDQGSSITLTHLTEHHIELVDFTQIGHRYRRESPAKQQAAVEEVERLFKEEIIERSASDYTSAPVMIRKSDGT